MDIIKTLSKSVREYKKYALLSPLFITLEVIMECLMPLTVSNMINTLNSYIDTSVEVSASELIQTMILNGLLLIVMAFISLFAGVMAARASAKAGSGFAKNLRHDIFYKIQDFSFANIDKFSTSSLVTRLTTDITNVQMTFMMIIRIAVRAPLLLIFAIAISFTYHPFLPLIFIAVIPLLVLGLLLVFTKAHPLLQRVFKKYDKLNSTVQENVRGMRVVKSYVREEYETKKFENASEQLRKDFVEAERIIAFNNPIMMSAMYISMTVIVMCGGFIIVSTGGTDLNVGDISSLTTYAVQILSSLMMLSFVFLMGVISSESAVRIVEVLKEQPTIKNNENPIMKLENGSIDFNNVSFKYKEEAEEYALKDINLHIKSGQTVGVIGGTGSSKSSLIQLISRLYEANEGDVIVSGHNVKEYDLKVLRNEVSVVLQKNVLFSGTIKENLRWGKEDASDEEIIEACKLAQADEFIQQLPGKYDYMITAGGSNVSGGQKQRLCIARALLKRPKILILDDSTSAVDTKTDALIRKGFKEFIPSTTKIIIAQRISSVQESDMIVVMENGRIDAIGSHEELLANNPIYQEVYYSQNKQGGNENE